MGEYVKDKIKLTKFESENPLHNEISALCNKGHRKGECKETILTQLDRLVDRLIRNKS